MASLATAGNNTYTVVLGSGGPDTIIADTFDVTPDGSCIVFSTLSAQQQPQSANQPLNYAAVALLKTTNVTSVMTLPPAAAPVFSPAPGTYSGTQSVTITCATGSSTIYYTLDGSTPTSASSVYSTPVSRTVPGTLNAIAIATGYGYSPVTSGFYNIS